MKFLIERTSDCFGKKQPCDGAVRESPITKWYYNSWSVEVNSIEELLKIAEIHPDGIVLYKTSPNTNGLIPEWTIEIYDTYRE